MKVQYRCGLIALFILLSPGEHRQSNNAQTTTHEYIDWQDLLAEGLIALLGKQANR